MNIDRISYFITEPYRLLGFLFLIVAGISICTEKTLTRGQGLVRRAKEPKTFWLIVAVWFLAGIIFIGFLSQKYTETSIAYPTGLSSPLAKHPLCTHQPGEKNYMRSQMRRWRLPVKLLVLFAVCAYLWTVGLALVPPTFRLPAPIVFLLCPACVLTITVDPSLPTVAFMLAPMNAFVYGLLDFGLGKLIRPSES